MDNLTYEQWSQLTPKERAEYNRDNIDLRKFKINEDGYIANLEFYRDGNWLATSEFDYLSDNLYRLNPQPPQAEITAKFVKDNNLKVGDRVKVVKKFENEEWIVWSEPMDKYIGEIGKVEEIHCDNIYVQFDDAAWSFLPKSLEKVVPTLSEQFKALIKEKGFEVGSKVVGNKYGYGEIIEIRQDTTAVVVRHFDNAFNRAEVIYSFFGGYDLTKNLSISTPQYRPFESIAEFAPNKDKFIIDKAGNIATFQAIDSDNRIKYACHGKKTFQEAFRDFEFINLTTGERSPFGVEI